MKLKDLCELLNSFNEQYPESLVQLDIDDSSGGSYFTDLEKISLSIRKDKTFLVFSE